jgi:DNA-binding PadR family transcriptional regulator
LKGKARNSGAPLSQPAFLILASLYESSKHGYAISKHIKETTDGRVSLSAATLYENLHKLLEYGYVRRDEETEVEPGKRRKTYSITAPGISVLAEQRAIWQSAARLIEGAARLAPGLC